MNKHMETKLNLLQLLLGFSIAIFLFNPYNIGNTLFLLISIYTIFQTIKKRFNFVSDVQFIVLCLFVFSYSLISYFYDFVPINLATKYILYFIFFYLFGRSIKYNNERGLLLYLYMVIFGLSMFGILSVSYSVVVSGNINASGPRLSAVPWLDGSEDLSATNVGCYLSLGIALAGMILVKSSKSMKLLNVVFAMGAIYSSILLGNRTGIIIAAISIAIVYMLRLKENSVKKNMGLLLITISCLIALPFMYDMDILGIKEIWEGSSSYARFEQLDLATDPRIDAWGEAFEGLFVNIFGGKETALSLYFAHNLWLDVGWRTGLLPFLLLVCFTFQTLQRFWVVYRSDYSKYTKFIITVILVGFYLPFFVEPIIEGDLYLFTAFCFISGVISGMARKNKIIEGKQTNANFVAN